MVFGRLRNVLESFRRFRRVVKATFHLTIFMSGQCATAKFKGIITITGVAGLL